MLKYLEFLKMLKILQILKILFKNYLMKFSLLQEIKK